MFFRLCYKGCQARWMSGYFPGVLAVHLYLLSHYLLNRTTDIFQTYCSLHSTC